MNINSAVIPCPSRSPFGGMLPSYVLAAANGLGSPPGGIPAGIGVMPHVGSLPSAMSPRLPASSALYEPEMRPRGGGGSGGAGGGGGGDGGGGEGGLSRVSSALSNASSPSVASVESLRMKAKEHSAELGVQQFHERSLAV